MKPRDCVFQWSKCLKIRHFLYRPNHGGVLGRHLFEYITGCPFSLPHAPLFSVCCKVSLNQRYPSKKYILSILNKFLTSWNLFSLNNSVVFRKATARIITFYPCLKKRNQRSIKENILVHFWQIYQKPSVVFLPNLYLQNHMRIVLAWGH